MIQSLLLGFSLGLFIAFLAWKAGALSLSGAWAATAVGGLIFGVGGLPWAFLLLLFFVSSSFWSKAFAHRKDPLSEKYAKGSQRDWGQVLANGGLAALLALAHGWLPDQGWLWIAYAAALATVNADTWATELGVFSPSSPRLITSGASIERGTSGGVTLIGYLAALAGAALIAVPAAFLSSPMMGKGNLVAAVILGALAGCTLDSILGATIQAIYYCSSCQKETERHPTHTCGALTHHWRGWGWLNNDWVNFISSLGGAMLAIALWFWLMG